MPTYQVDVGDKTYEVDAPDPNTAWQWANYTHTQPVAPAPKPAGFSLKNLGTAFSQGAVGSAKAITDVAGAGNAASQYLGGVSENLSKQYTPERQAEMQRQQERMKKAEQSGSTWEEIKAGVQNIAEAPIESVAQGLGSFVPYIPAFFISGPAAAALGLGKGAQVAANVVAKAYAPVVGTAQGAGAVKGAIYDAVYKAEIADKVPEAEARQKAEAAQDYAGKNLDQIALGAGLGYVASKGGVEKFLTKEGREKAGEKLLPRVGKAMAEESVTEGAQGGQERLASNIALQRTGRDVPTFQGVAGQAAQEGIIGGLTAGPVSAIGGRGPKPEVTPEAPPEVTPEAPTYKAAPSLTGTDAATLLEEQAKGTAGTDLLASARDRQAEQDRIQQEEQAQEKNQQRIAQERTRQMPGMIGSDTTGAQLIQLQRENQAKEEAAAEKAKEIEYRKILATTYSADPLQNFRQQQAAIDRLDYTTPEVKAQEPAMTEQLLALQQEDEKNSEQEPRSQTLVIAPPSEVANVTKPVVTETKPEPFVEAAPIEGESMPKSIDQIETEKRADEQVEPIQKYVSGLTKKPMNLWNVLRGRLSASDVSDISPDFKYMALRQPAKKGGGTDLSELVQSGQLDEFLPPAMRMSMQDPNEMVDETDAVEYIKEKLRGSNEDYYTYDTQVALRQAFGSIEEAENAVNEFLRIEDANELLAEAAAEQRAIDKETEVVTPEGEDRTAQESVQEGLTAPTPESLKAQEERAKAEEKRLADERKAEKDKAKADAEVGEFTLTGSNRPADVAEAAGQKSMFSLRGKPEGQLQAFEQSLRTLLNKFGLKDIGLKLSEGMRDEGSYAAKLIQIAADSANPIRTLRHEAIHALRELGFFTDAQWKSLSKMAKDKWIDQYLKQRNIDGKPLKAGEESRYDAYMREYKGDMEKITEEAVADAFADFDTKPPAGMIQAIIQRLRNLFQSIRSALTKMESAEQIFGKVEKGALKPEAERTTTESKSLRDKATANFKRWFGDSKVVNKNGDPLIMYHGTPNGEIGVFHSDSNGLIFTTPYYDVAQKYSELTQRSKNFAGLSPTVHEVYVKAKNTLDFDNLSPYTGEAWQKIAENAFNYPENGGKFNEEDSKAEWSDIEEFGGKELFQAIKDAGYDSVAVTNKGNNGNERELAVFSSTQIKSATGNNGDYSLTDADIRKSLRTQAGKAKEKAQELLQKRKPINKEGLAHVNDPDFVERLGKVFNPRSNTIIDKIEGMKDGFWRRTAQGLADQYRTIKDYDMRSYMLARMSKTQDGGLEGLMFNGHIFNDGGALNIKKDTKGLMESLKPVGEEVDSYMMWIALNRESNLAEGKKSPELSALALERDKLSQGMLNGKSRLEVYKSVQKDMNALNKSVLDIALDMGLINSSKREIAELESREGMDEKKRAERIAYLKEHPGAYEQFTRDVFYIPFYKFMENGDVQSAVSSAGLTKQKFSAELKGMSDKPFADLMENTLRNWSHILSASMKNQAAVSTIEATMEAGAVIPNMKAGLAYQDGQVISTKSGEVVGDGKLRPEYTESTPGMASLTKVMKDGQPMYFEVLDPMLLDSITSIGYMGPKSKFLEVARDFKNMLQFGVTISPTFKVNNLIRDSISAMAVSDLKKNPFANVVEGWNLSAKNDPAHIEALAGGAIFNFGSTYEGDQAKLVKRLLKQGVKAEHILDTKGKIEAGLKGLWEKYQELGNKSEAANRLALYKQMRDKGMSHLEAAFQARDLLDFSMQGSWPAFRTVTMVVPFLNARVQGLYKLGRDGVMPTSRVMYNTITGKELWETDANGKLTQKGLSDKNIEQKKAFSFSIVTTAVSLASMALYMAFKDDEDYKKRDEWDRDNFWWIKLPNMDYALRVPKPFEIGAFGTMSERILEQIIDQGAEGKTFGDSLSRMLFDTFAMNPMPQMFKPLLDLYANKDSFTGAPIESAGMERLSKQERMTDQTSPLAKALGGMSQILGEKGELSPAQVDYAIKGYFGWLGATASATSMYAVMPFKEGAYPDTNWMDKASLGLVRTLPSNQSKYTTAFYDANKEISQAFSDMRHYADIGDSEKVQQLLEEKGDKIRLSKLYDKTAKNMANVRKQIRIVMNDDSLDGATKKAEIDRMKEIISMYAEQAESIRKSLK